MNKMMRNKRGGRPQDEKPAFDQYILDLARVTRVTEGGKHLSFRACVILGDRRGRVAYGVAKGKDVQLSVEKAVHQAKKNFISVPIVNETIPHWVESKFKSARVMLKPAPRGSGLIAGGAVRAVLELAGIPNVSSKILNRTKNKILIVKATFDALKQFKTHQTKAVPVMPEVQVKIEVEDPNDKIVKIKKKITPYEITSAHS